MNDTYDAIVIGAGAGGGVAACVLAEAGKRVLLLERGWQRSFVDVPSDHLRNQRLARYGHNAGPNDDESHPRTFVGGDGKTHVVRPWQSGYQNNAAAVGGGTLVYGAQAWRFLPDDFRLASRYGVPAGSSLADWPISYADLEPHYEQAEHEIGVAGDGQAMSQLMPRSRDYPMPPAWDNPQRRILGRGAQSLGWHTVPVPLLINTTRYNGRDTCGRCGMCVGFACPTDGKNGTQNTVVPRALKTGLCTLITRAFATSIDIDDRGNVVGVSYVRDDGTTVTSHSARSRIVICSGGAVESARLLLNARSKHHPNGLGNRHDQVGRNLQGHCYTGAFGWFDEIMTDSLGPGPSIATARFNHGNAGIIGGGMLANEFVPMPLWFWYSNLPPDAPRWGLAAKRAMRDGYTRVIQVQGPVQDIPSPDARVTLDPDVRDKYGVPVARMSGAFHPETIRVAQFMHERAKQWLDASGATRVWGKPPAAPYLSGGQHQAGTCRMGNDPKLSVTDSFGRVHAHDNLYVIDGSIHVTNGGFNPVLTILALAYRCAQGASRGLA